MSKRLTSEDIQKIAGYLNITPAALYAVIEVEFGNGSGFVDETKAKIIFEGQVFWTELKRAGIDPVKYQKGNDDILYPKYTKTKYLGGVKEYTRLEKARKINADVANKSTKWGFVGILGLEYRHCGCSTIDEFIEKMQSSEYDQLLLFANWLISNRLNMYLQNNDWKGFARIYNGPGYAINQYDKKLAMSFAKYSYN